MAIEMQRTVLFVFENEGVNCLQSVVGSYS